MRISRDHLVWKALVALSHAANRADDAPIVDAPALRFALAFLFSVGNGERQSFDDYWMVMRDPMSWTNDTSRKVIRGTNMRAALMGIARAVGVELRDVRTYNALDDCARRLDQNRRGE